MHITMTPEDLMVTGDEREREMTEQVVLHLVEEGFCEADAREIARTPKARQMSLLSLIPDEEVPA